MRPRAAGDIVPGMIEVRELTKDYGEKRALNALSFTARPGVVTGLLGPNSSGKSTALRIIFGREEPSSGTVLVNGRRHATADRPLQHVGASLEAGTLYGERCAAEHVGDLACRNGISRRRAAEVLDDAGLSAMAGTPISGFSLGMRQRLGIACALLGDPGVLLFDEPVHGLDPAGIQWFCDLVRCLAEQGRTVLVASHAVSEMTLIADRLLVIDHGELITETAVSEASALIPGDVFVRSPRRGALARALAGEGACVLAEPDGGLSVTGLAAWRIAAAAADRQLPIQELTPRPASRDGCYLPGITYPESATARRDAR